MEIADKKRNTYKQVSVFERTENLIRLLSKAQGKSIVESTSQLYESLWENFKDFNFDGSLNVKFTQTEKGLLIEFAGVRSCLSGMCTQKEYEAMLNKERFP